MNGEQSQRLQALLEAEYRLEVRSIEQLARGNVTTNYRAETSDGTVFVKCYPENADLNEQRGAIELSRVAGLAGAPVASVKASVSGGVIATRAGSAVSVWDWVDGDTPRRGLDPDAATQIGRTLGLIHRTFASLPQSADKPVWSEAWLQAAGDAGGVRSLIDKLRREVDARLAQGGDDFDRAAAISLPERASMLASLPNLAADLPALTSQIIHGDYSTANLLFDGGRLAAVVDFEAPTPFFPAYDLGRIAFFPDTLVCQSEWPIAASALLAAYREENPLLPSADIRACGRVALIQLVKSLYGIRQHYLSPQPLQRELDVFWAWRHESAKTMLANLPLIDQLARQVA